MARYVSLIQFTDQGIRNIKDTIKRGEASQTLRAFRREEMEGILAKIK